MNIYKHKTLTLNLINHYKIPNIIAANEAVLMNDVYLVVIHADRIPPHLLVSVQGKLFTLNVKGPSVDGELTNLLRLIKQRSIETIFIKLAVPAVFTLQQLSNEIKKHTLAYPRVDVGVATCLNPIKDFCSSIYETETTRVNFVFDLLPKLYEKEIITFCYHLNLEKKLQQNSFYISKYTMHDINEGIRQSAFQLSY